jgi:hypothetical protein
MGVITLGSKLPGITLRFDGRNELQSVRRHYDLEIIDPHFPFQRMRLSIARMNSRDERDRMEKEPRNNTVSELRAVSCINALSTEKQHRATYHQQGNMGHRAGRPKQ